ncbi:elongation factor 4 [Candidatus Daviesbacteria bacterium RIFCSPHIGHO2_01_FULL_40_24]|uniref:Elongation factor 4 n=1 Tax=Candidatus Daviesbacteria bacterium GW2011_GWC2_40_12 TaxID=1618431 RepID=A0A0G0QXB4_9BACT|nr:MAG: Elongation factor 4 [Candidatus Daviesbacteria bacterium GW2011_GWF2_38_7]KKR17007.1 MAG: Elongation factor 4 [Candidatus Daviesbacteria bacterium GW2011_GWA2_39_33]KKR42071.1 MAG: Elongation factor 4 [Candidatus Daviesbacteria bacterium GW2011_GWC2_40_12]OGE20838.1 MAG: elongation factor 4 [Candidatus Daviesbacteria bacterium RIFCSPHIGHO2_01_FULL_40_24]OGE28190.1 MAG: elongation factor 4 [Candidatus Daviesbacteria bacterium RIFCSPHIGHO2_02_FULL_40_16]OGE41811.1 MAG: elongation factor 
MNIRNFSIIAHIDHGKSTLADRLLEITGTVTGDKMKPQLLDSLALERERGITIKLAPVRLNYTLPPKEGRVNAIPYTLNLIDTPGHVDFSYEVSRALAAVEGAVLLVDATQGIQAQTLAHGLAALEQNLLLIPVVNKIDLPNADCENAKKQLIDTFGFSEEEILLVSGKTGQGVDKLLEAIVTKIPPPKQEKDKPFKALIFDSFFDSFKGVVAQVRVMEGTTPKNQEPIVFLGTKASGHVLETGFFTPQLIANSGLSAGEIGYIATGIKEPDLVRVGDTIAADFFPQPLPGYKEVKPMVFVGLFPIDADEYFELKEALAKFRLTDPAFSYVPEHSQALGAGFRCGFLGLLHAEVVQERLSGEFNVDLLATAPSVGYLLNDSPITSPSDLAQGENIKGLKEPWVKLRIFVPQTYIGPVMELVQDKRGKFLDMQHFGVAVEMSYEMPLSEMVSNFYDRLKSVSSGFASLDWELLDYREVDAVRVDILVGGEKVDALSTIVYRPKAEGFGRRMVEKLKEVLPRQNFVIAIQAAIGGTIIARETLSAFRKDVLMHGSKVVGGGDYSRKRKLLEKQKKGKKKMKMVGSVEIPQEAFLSILKS